MKFAIVTSTINIPYLLDDYANNFRQCDWKDVIFVIAGDKKTPVEISDYCKKLEEKYGYKVYYLGLDEQEKIDTNLYKFIPFNSVERRNFAILFAYRQNADIIVTIDDDNLYSSGDYLKENSIVGTTADLIHITTNIGWYNVCETLEEDKNRYFFYRGYPIDKRVHTDVTTSQKSSKIIVNAGLWKEAPDTDAIAWLNFGELNVIKFKDNIFGKNFVLGNGTWCPFDTQNVAIAREAIPAFFLDPYQLRYADIWASFVVRKIADYLSHSVSYGQPIVLQKRNPHNYMKDLRDEQSGMERTPALVNELRSIELTGTTYLDCAHELIDKLSDSFKDLKEGYNVWLKAIEKVESQ